MHAATAKGVVAHEKAFIGKRVAILVSDGFRASWSSRDPRRALEDEVPAVTEIVGQIPVERAVVKAWKHTDWGRTLKVDVPLKQVHADRYDALLAQSGGVTSPDRLRLEPEAIAFIRKFGDADKPIAAICHGPWTLIDAGLVVGKTMTSWPSLRTDLRNGGANWIDEDSRFRDRERRKGRVAFGRRDQGLRDRGSPRG